MYSPRIFVILAIFAFLCQISYADKILFLLPLASKSHVNVFTPLMKALGEKGHEIVALSPTVSKDMPPTVRHVQLITVDDLTGHMDSAFDTRKRNFFAQMMNSSMTKHMDKACIKSLEHPKLKELMEKETFDLVIVDIFLNYCVLPVIPHFKAASIFVSTFTTPPTIANLVGNRLPPSFVPSAFLKFGDKMSFLQRMVNTLGELFIDAMWHFMFIAKNEKLYKEHLPNGQSFPGIQEISDKVSMIFSNSHFSLTGPRPLLPDHIEVGGMHCRPAKKLPKELDEFLSGSGEDGFIFFSLGSIVKPQEMPEETRKAFINVFSKLKQRVLWKWDGEPMADLPKNVQLGKWLPQQDILGHPKIKLFITHGGLLSTQESVYHGVPVLGLPLFGDQDLNVHRAERDGYAKFLEILDLKETDLMNSITELLTNPTYSKKVKDLSKIVRDLPETPLEKAVYWTEYVLRHHGAPHLRSGARDLNFFQYYVLDVAAALFAIVLITTFIIIRCCKAACRCICRKEKKSKTD